MRTHEKYMKRCLQLAALAQGNTSPNPMVGAVVVHNGKIIGEGFHEKYGKPHAEVNSIDSVKDKNLLKDSTIYVSLEPCCHYGKTPPCTVKIIESGIRNVVIASLDPFSKVNGGGVKVLKEAGINVEVGILEKEAQELNKAFYTYNLKKRPYVFFKWAQSIDGFIDRQRNSDEAPSKITGKTLQVLTHKKRAYSDAILVGTDTAIMDKPDLTVRKWKGNNPLKIVIDRTGRIDVNNSIFDKGSILLFSEKEIKGLRNNVELVLTPFQDIPNEIVSELYKREIQSLMIEGGTKLIESFAEANIWDEAFCLVSDICIGNGKKAPSLNKQAVSVGELVDCNTRILHFVNT